MRTRLGDRADMNKKCQHCNIEFDKKKTASAKTWGKQMFCSRNCANIAKRGIKSNNALDVYYLTHKKDTSGLKKFNKESGSWNKGKPFSEEFKKKMSDVRRGVTFNTGRTHFKKGAHPWNYRGATSQIQLDRTRFAFTIGRIVKERDDYTCFMCKKRGGYLHADHILSWKENVNDRFDANNCRTVCRSCHFKLTFNKDMPLDSKWGMPGFKNNIRYADATRRTS